MLIRVSDGNGHRSVLFNAGVSINSAIKNAGRMRLDLTEIKCIFLSHGNYDHFGGLTAIAGALRRNNMPIIVHEDMFKIRGVASSDGTIRRYPRFPTEEEIKPARYVKTR